MKFMNLWSDTVSNGGGGGGGGGGQRGEVEEEKEEWTVKAKEWCETGGGGGLCRLQNTNIYTHTYTHHRGPSAVWQEAVPPQSSRYTCVEGGDDDDDGCGCYQAGVWSPAAAPPPSSVEIGAPTPSNDSHRHRPHRKQPGQGRNKPESEIIIIFLMFCALSRTRGASQSSPWNLNELQPAECCGGRREELLFQRRH